MTIYGANLKDLIDIVTDYWTDSHCAHAVTKSILQFNKYSKDSEPILNALTGFGEGIGERSICGSVTGAVASLGLLLKEKGISDDEIKKIIEKFKMRFKERNQSLYCSELLSPYLRGDEPYPPDPLRLPVCTQAVITATIIAQQIVNETIELKINL